MTSLRLARYFGLFFLFALRLFAQETWTAVTSPTTQDLWGVTWAGDQFIAVGQSGTILTSPDGNAWTVRNSATTAWLLAVTYSPTAKKYVVVGDNGTVLTSPDAINWTPRTSGTTERLNGIAFGNGVFVAVGEHGTVTSSNDGVTWTAQSLGSAMWLRGIAYAGGGFITGGAPYIATDPAFAYTSTDGRTFQSRPSPWSEGAESISTDGQQVLVAGGHYVYLADITDLSRWRTLYYSPPNGISVPPDEFFPAYLRSGQIFHGIWCAGGDTGKVLHAPISGGIPWHRLNVPATAPGLNQFNGAAVSEAAVVVVGSSGMIYHSEADQNPAAVRLSDLKVATSAKVGDTVTLDAYVAGGGPMTCQWYLNGQPIAGATTVPLVLPSAQLMQSGSYTLVETNSSGQATSSPHSLTVISPLPSFSAVDTSFVASVAVNTAFAEANGAVLVSTGNPLIDPANARLLRLDARGRIDSQFQPLKGVVRQLFEATDGKIFVWYVDGTSPRQSPLVRLNHDGSRDASFEAPVDLFSSDTPSQDTRFVVLQDGRILVVSLSNNQLTFVRLTGDGRVDPTYVRDTVTAAPPSTEVGYYGYEWLVSAEAPDGSLVFAASSAARVGTGRYGHDRTFMVRLRADGTRDPAFNPVTVEYFVTQLAWTGTYIYYFGGTTSVASIGTHNGRLLANGAEDPSYARIDEYQADIEGPLAFLQPDGSFVWLSARYGPSVSAPGWTEYRKLRLYKPEGAWDPQFRGTIPDGSTIRSILTGSAGVFFATGDFPALNTPENTHPQFARLVVDTAPAATRLINISVRQSVDQHGLPLTLGFSIEGANQISPLLRGVGPTLTQFGVSDALADPAIQLVHANTSVLVNENWQDFPDQTALSAATAQSGTFGLTPGSRDAAAVTLATAGTYTMQVMSRAGAGIALAEVYDPGYAPHSYAEARIVNFSAMANTRDGAGTLTAGFTIDGPGIKRILIRGVGPSLQQFFVRDYVSDPMLTVYRGSTPIAWNDQAESGATAPGAFPLNSSLDAALVLTLPAGVYSAQLQSTDGGSGTALVEVYELRD